MKRLIPISFAALLATATLAGCGLRGDLERPDPIFSEPEAEEVVETPTTRTVARNVTVIRRNANGDIIPDAAPSTPVSEGGLEDIE